jgi:hypothetical protein
LQKLHIINYKNLRIYQKGIRKEGIKKMKEYQFLKNEYIYEKEDGSLNMEVLDKNPWLKYLVITDNISTNRERVHRIADITGKETIDYVLTTLDILEEIYRFKKPNDYAKNILARTLQWAEVSKGGTNEQREAWRAKGYPLEIHNLASAEIYKDESKDDIRFTNVVYTLIKTHGIIGQNIRGEVSFCENAPLLKIRNFMTKDFFTELLFDLNKCIMEAVDPNIWSLSNQIEVSNAIDAIWDGNFSRDEDSEKRVENLFSKIYPDTQEMEEAARYFEKKVFPFFQLWYCTSATKAFGKDEIISLFDKILDFEDINKVDHINFKPLADSLYYDYEDEKYINIYKLRIIQKYLAAKFYEGNEKSLSDSVDIDLTVSNKTLMVNFKFTPVCEKLIEFCVEAERSGYLSYEKSIDYLYNMFGFKKDEFDRLNNTDKYLSTMNDAAASKRELISKVVGEKIVDVGSGGGILLDLLEATYPDKEIIGTDISSNVIETLKTKKQLENHKWTVVKHNFVDGPLTEKVDSIIFSSILHEIFSYTDTPNGKFNIESVKASLRNAYLSLNKGGRIIIRDGVKTEGDGTLTISLDADDSVGFFSNYMHDFKGLPDNRKNIVMQGNKVSGDVNFIREFLYTYTWGAESYSHEVEEQFGYFTLNEFKKFFEDELHVKIIEAREFFEEGYYDNLKDKIGLNRKDYPNSNCVVVVEKV